MSPLGGLHRPPFPDPLDPEDSCQPQGRPRLLDRRALTTKTGRNLSPRSRRVGRAQHPATGHVTSSLPRLKSIDSRREAQVLGGRVRRVPRVGVIGSPVEASPTRLSLEPSGRRGAAVANLSPCRSRPRRYAGSHVQPPARWWSLHSFTGGYSFAGEQGGHRPGWWTSDLSPVAASARRGDGAGWQVRLNRSKSPY
jgi:hypothetical protein